VPTRRAPTRQPTRVYCMRNSMQLRGKCVHSNSSNAVIHARTLHAKFYAAPRKVYPLEELQRGNPRVCFACKILCSFEEGVFTRRAPTRQSTRVFCMQNSMQLRGRCTHSKSSNAAIHACALHVELCSFEEGAPTRRAPTRQSTCVLCVQNSMQLRQRCILSKSSNAAIHACALHAEFYAASRKVCPLEELQRGN
jgi:hypothetical protein